MAAGLSRRAGAGAMALPEWYQSTHMVFGRLAPLLWLLVVFIGIACFAELGLSIFNRTLGGILARGELVPLPLATLDTTTLRQLLLLRLVFCPNHPHPL